MIHAFQEIYLSSARKALGEMFDYVVNSCGLEGGFFVKLFLVSSACSRIEHGEAAYLVGKSGIEIAREVFAETTGKEMLAEPQISHGRSAEYWIGWAIGYYQWYSDRRFQDIFAAISFEEMLFLYPTLHEADISKFVDLAEKRIHEVFPETNLKRIRSAYGCSQAQLARGSGVSLRSIQMYEQRQKDINKASARTLYSLAKFLGCRMENLIEH